MLDKTTTTDHDATLAPRSIAELYSHFKIAVANLEATTGDLPDGAARECVTLAGRIVTSQADSIEDMLIKITVAGWCVTGLLSDDWELNDGEELDCLISLRDDLRRLLASGREMSLGAEHPAFRLRVPARRAAEAEARSP